MSADLAPARPASSTAPPQGWRGRLSIDYRRDGDRTVSHDIHEGPLRVLQRLYPEGPGICHHVLVHPPGGLVGGDELDVQLSLANGSHAVLTTPGAARFYRSTGAAATQQVTAHLADNARLEWLPLETLAYRGCVAHNRLRFELAPGAQMLGWDMLALGLPAAGEPFDSGVVEQRLEWPGVWLERGRIAATDTALLQSPLGLAGQSVLATLWWASGTPLTSPEREAMLDSARACFAEHPALAPRAGVSALDGRLVVARVLADRVEPVFDLWCALRDRWRTLGWGLAADRPRIWRT
jgi:urease accessory protein